MKVSFSWLLDHLDSPASLHDITAKLVELGLEVDGLSDPAARYEGFIVAEVVDAAPHPNADRLRVCAVSTGEGAPLQVVCGASNVRTGLKIAFAQVGAVIPVTGQPLKKGNIRGLDSSGMICSAEELCLPEGSLEGKISRGEDLEKGILELESQARPGQPLAEFLELTDPVIDVSLTPNRADCFSIRGIARDLAAAGLGTLRPLPKEEHKGTLESSIQVSIETPNAPFFSGRLIQGVANRPSPGWLQKRLLAVGLRPLSALVDITNYICHAEGRPLHVFDADKIQGNICVRQAQDGELFEALNGKTYELTPDMVVIADEKGVLALGGIMGGLHSSCTETTQNVFVESALFNPISIARTGQKLGLLSDARTRFERGVDPHSTLPGLAQATNLILEFCKGEEKPQVSAVVTVGKLPLAQATPLVLKSGDLQSLTGCDIPLSQAALLLKGLGFTLLSESSTSLEVVAPSWRMDCTGPEDLIEEVLRLQGYHHIPTTALPLVENGAVEDPLASPLVLQQFLATRGLQETITYSFISEELASKFSENAKIEVANPLSRETAVMRPTVIASLFDAALANGAKGQSQVAFFEVAQTYQWTEGKPHQEKEIAGLRMGKKQDRHWSTASLAPQGIFVDVFDVKADVLSILGFLGFAESSFTLVPESPSYYHPGRSGSLKLGNKVVAYFGEIHPQLLQEADRALPLSAFEVFVDRLPLKGRPKKAKPLKLAPYPPIERDFAFVVDENIGADRLLRLVEKIRLDSVLKTPVTLLGLNLFDVFRDERLGEAKKSVAFQVRLQPLERTLTEEDIGLISAEIISVVSQQTGGVLR